jgi:hypothetical protein
MKNDQLFMTLEGAPEAPKPYFPKPYFKDALSFLILLANGGQAPAPGLTEALEGFSLKKWRQRSIYGKGFRKRAFKTSGNKTLLKAYTQRWLKPILKGAGGLVKGFAGGGAGGGGGEDFQSGEADPGEMEGQGMKMPSGTFAGFNPGNLGSVMSPGGLKAAEGIFNAEGAGSFLMKNKGKLIKMTKSSDGAQKVETFDPGQAPKTYDELKEGVPVETPGPTGPMPFSANIGGETTPTTDDMNPPAVADGGQIRPDAELRTDTDASTELMTPPDTAPVPIAPLDVQAAQAQGLVPSDAVNSILADTAPSPSEEALSGIFDKARSYSLRGCI